MGTREREAKEERTRPTMKSSAAGIGHSTTAIGAVARRCNLSIHWYLRGPWLELVRESTRE